jgi:hypothetical protein
MPLSQSVVQGELLTLHPPPKLLERPSKLALVVDHLDVQDFYDCLYLEHARGQLAWATQRLALLKLTLEALALETVQGDLLETLGQLKIRCQKVITLTFLSPNHSCRFQDVVLELLALAQLALQQLALLELAENNHQKH